MIRGVWISAGAMNPAMRAQEILTNNLANANSGGFRQDRVAFHRLASAAAGAAGGSILQPGPGGLTSPPELATGLDLSAGPLETTDERFHLAVSGPGFFTLQGPEGELYTRDGDLARSPDGTLVHRATGYPILGEGGAVVVPEGADFAVAADGTAFVGGTAVGRLRLAALTDPSTLRHAGSGLVQSDGPAAPDTTSQVLQGVVEGANVDPVQTMVDMMTLLRAYEANQRAILTQDSSLGHLIQWAAG